MKLFLGLLVSFVFIVAITAVGVCSELIAAWSFEEGSGDVVKDISGNGHNGVINNAVFVEGKIGKALEFDGTTSVVEVPSDDALNVDEVTVEAWVNPSGYNSEISAVAQKWGDNTNRRQYLLCFYTQKALFYASGTGTSWPSAMSGNTVPIGEWTHVAGTYDGKTIRIYVNGKLDGETASGEGLFASDVPVWIGGYGPGADIGNNRHFPGIVDEVRIWDGALSEEEISQGMNKSLAAVSSVGKLSTTWGSVKNAR